MIDLKIGDKIIVKTDIRVYTGNLFNQIGKIIGFAGTTQNLISIEFDFDLGCDYFYVGAGKRQYCCLLTEKDIILCEKRPPKIYKVAEFCLNLNKKEI
jgi:hypothetical protein